MPHPTTPSGEIAATGPSYPEEGLKSQTMKAGFKVAERPLATILSSGMKPAFTGARTEVQFPYGDASTPPQSPPQSPLCKPSTHQAIPNILSPPLTPEIQRYPKAFTVGKAGNWKGFTGRLLEESSVGEYKGLYNNASNMANEKEVQAGDGNRTEDISQTAVVPTGTLPNGPLNYEGTFELRASKEGYYEEYGRGAWSIVYRAEHTPSNRTGVGKGGNAKTIVAVKSPLSQGSVLILEHEALILTHLSQTAMRGESAHNIVTFLGYDLPTKSLILESVPLTLAAYSKACALEAKKKFSHKTMRDPIVGTQCWLQIVDELVEGLGFLQRRDVVHGDIKPTNILMRPRSGGGSSLSGNNENIYPGEHQDATTTFLPYSPLFCDFSSSSLLTNPTPPSALTSRFAAPELLDPRTPGIATFASDTYSLALSLLSPALGEDVYAAAANGMQALHWAKEGRPLDFARSGESGLRVGKGGVVDGVLGGATRKEAGERWGVREWRGAVKGVIGGGSDEGAGK
ncbi:MAG: hypothetical protein M1839_008094 [Geoglossum umbratile]|nr:MAG: hypothetical protein M1839_008094 [Geoglossum umbratile]